MKLSLRWVIIISSFVLVWGTQLVITPSSYFMSENNLTKHMKDIMKDISDLILEQSYNYLGRAQSAAALANRLLESHVIGGEIEGPGSLERYFFDQLSLYPYISGIYVSGLNGDFFMVSRDARYSSDGFRTKIIRHRDGEKKVELIWRDTLFNQIQKDEAPQDSYDPRNRPWFRQVLEKKQICWTDPYVLYNEQKPGVSIAGPYFDENGALIGIVGVSIELQELSNFISRLQVGKSGKAFIINQNGDLIAFYDANKLIYTDVADNMIRLPKVNEINDIFTRKAFDSIQWKRDDNNNIQLQTPICSTFKLSGKRFLSLFTPFPEKRLPWIIGAYIPEDDYLGLIKSNRTFNIIATIVLSVIASFIGLVLAEKIIRPVENLANEAKAIEQHDMKSHFKTESTFKELQEAADAFALMKASLVSYEGRLNESQNLYRAIAKTANDAIIMMDNNHCISYLNPAAERMFGYTQEQAKGKNLHRLLAPKKNIPQYENGLGKFSLKGKGPFIDRTVNVTAVNRYGMEFPAELSLSALQIKGKWHAIAIIRNITERKKAEQLRKRMADDLHDGLGGSLTNIKLFAEMTKSLDNREMTQKNLEAIADICADCIHEIRNYMNVLDDFELQWDALVPELNQYCLKTLEPHDIKFSVTSDIDPDAPPPTRLMYINLQKIVKEAVTNVIKHSNGDAMHIAMHVAKDRLLFIISDNGSVSRTTKSQGRGLLSMASRAKEMGGVIDVSWDSGVVIMLDVPLLKMWQVEVQ